MRAPGEGRQDRDKELEAVEELARAALVLDPIRLVAEPGGHWYVILDLPSRQGHGEARDVTFEEAKADPGPNAGKREAEAARGEARSVPD